MMDDLLQEMINPAPAPRDGARRRRLWTTVVIVGLAAIGATALTTSALFTDQDETSAAIHTGTVDLALGVPTPLEFTPTNLAPGDSTFFPITVSNKGSLGLRYSISYSGVSSGPGTGTLTTVLQLRMYSGASDCSAAGTASATVINNAGAVDNWPTTPAVLVGGLSFPGNNRELPGGNMPQSTENLCARVDFPLSAGNEYQDTSATLTLIFDAEQIANN